MFLYIKSVCHLTGGTPWGGGGGRVQSPQGLLAGKASGVQSCSAHHLW